MDRTELVDAAELAVSELVTNALLHANTDIDVAVVAMDVGVRIEVCDDHAALPAARHYGDYATTGRGLDLVSALAVDVGIEPREPTGKRIWFTLHSGAPSDDPIWSEWDTEALWDTDHLPARPAAGPAIMLQQLPVTLWTAAQQHHDAVLRELVLHRSVSPHQVWEEDELTAARQAESLLASAIDAALARAGSDGLETIALPENHPSPLQPNLASLDVMVATPDDPHRLFGALQNVLDDAERLAAQGQLLVRPALPEVIALRDWCCEQAVAQANDVPPTPWGGTAREVFARGESVRFEMSPPDWDPSGVRDSDRCALAADDNNRLIAVSVPAAEMFGWPVDLLVGRRVVTLVPHRFREAHVAGFTRHLTTGESHALGVKLDLPVLHADGHEVLCTFLIEHVPAPQGRSVYISWLTPLNTDTGDGGPPA